MHKSGNTHLAPQPDKTLDYVLDIIKEGVWDWDANTGKVARSPGWYRMLGYDVDCLPGTVFTWENVIHPDDYERVMNHFEHYITGKSDSYEIEYRCRKADGDYLWIRDQGKIVEYNEDGSVARMIGAHLDIHDQKLAQSALERQNELLNEDKFTLEHLINQRTHELEQAYSKLEDNLRKIEILRNTDSLTSIYNRHKLETELKHEIARSRRYSSPLSTALFDIDNFKDINDSHGHQIGDLALQKISQLVQGHIRETDIPGRWGGDEFLLILPGINASEAEAIIEKIRNLICVTPLLDSISITCSFGLTEFIEGDTLGSLFRRMDNALYRSKKAGRNTTSTEYN